MALQKNKEVAKKASSRSTHSDTDKATGEATDGRANRAPGLSGSSAPPKEEKLSITKVGKAIGDVALRLGSQSLGTKSVMSMLVNDSPEQLEELRGTLEVRFLPFDSLTRTIFTLA